MTCDKCAESIDGQPGNGACAHCIAETAYTAESAARRAKLVEATEAINTKWNDTYTDWAEAETKTSMLRRKFEIIDAKWYAAFDALETFDKEAQG